jgi:hypothetical protein
MRYASKTSQASWAVLAVAALFVFTAVSAIAAAVRPHAVTPQLWKQQPATPAFVLSLPGGYGVEEALY